MRGDFRDEARRFEDIDKAQPLPSPLCNWPKCEEWATVTLRNGEKALSPLVSRNFACVEHAADYVACGMVIERVEDRDTALRCVGAEGCVSPVTHIDNKGFIYCASHGEARRFARPCRKMRKWEIARLEGGQTISWEPTTRAPKDGTR